MTADDTLKKQLQSFGSTLKAGRGSERYFASDADFGFIGGIVRGADAVGITLAGRSAAATALRARATGEVVATKWLSKGIAIVDGVFEGDEGRGWFTEVWQGGGRESHVIRTSRIRVGSPEDPLRTLNQLSPAVVEDDLVTPAVRSKEEKALRQQFKAFRKAFNAGDLKGVTAIFAPKADAIPVFSFLRGGSQVLQGRAAVASKQARLMGQEAINPAITSRARGAQIVTGEPKVIRFLSENVAVVDGTGEMTGVPRAHGFAPETMKGVYTNYWRKSGSTWQIEAARPWF